MYTLHTRYFFAPEIRISRPIHLHKGLDQCHRNFHNVFNRHMALSFAQTGATSSWNTGPPSDHTTQNGYYMYVETSWPRKYGDKAWLVSRNFQGIFPNSEPCKLRFFYHMYGDSAEKLNVYIRTYQNGSAQQRVWNKVGSQGSIWNRAVIPLSSTKAFQV